MRAAATSQGDAAAEPELDEDVGEMPRGGLLRTGLGSIWILLALTATCYRVCSGG
jgi:hypothetical protein